jgi:hypothetical protein
MFEYFSKKFWEYSSFIKIWQEKRVLYVRIKNYFLSFLVQIFLDFEMFQTKFEEKIKTHILCSVTFFSKILPFMR